MLCAVSAVDIAMWDLKSRGITKGCIELHQDTSGNKAIDVFSYMIYNKEQTDTSRYKAEVLS